VRRFTPIFVAALATAACGPEPAPVAPPPPPALAPAPAPAPLAIADDPAAAARIAADVTYLASPELAGRGTGEEGARLAAELVKKRFAELHLQPLGGGGDYLQPFQARVGAKVETPRIEVTRQGRGRAATTDDTPLVTADGSASGTVHGQAVFVGHGITAPAVGWDDYGGQQLDGKIVVVLDGVPTPPEPSAKKHLVKTPPSPNPLRDFGSVRYKLRTAREHHAAGVIIVSAGDTLPAAPADASSMGAIGVVLRRGAAGTFFPTLHLDKPRVWEPEQARKPVSVPLDDVKITTRIDPVDATAWNVAGLLPGREGSLRRDEIVVIGAHYDHLGHGGTSASRAPGSHEIHPGADDNASGTALLLEVARRLAALPVAPDRSVLFLAFGAEEIGTIGSRWWVEHPTAPRERVVGMINADMVGRLRDNRFVVDGVGTSAGWTPLVHDAAQGLGLDLAFGAEGFGASDHASFTAVRVPVAFFFTGVHPDYHMPSDTADKINAAGEERVATLAARLGLAVAQAPERLVFVDAPADPHRGMRGGFKVSLGTIPDYGFAGTGVKLDGVRPDAPAARAGLARGDVIVKLGGHEVGNIHDYMFALGELEAGREAVIEVEREGKRLPLKIVPAPGR
jgi:Zn-dependent M28 family amino/carboxypeptidase